MKSSPLRHWARRLLLPPLAVIFLVEDLLIRSFGHAMGIFARLELVARFESWARKLRPWQALMLFALPAIVLLPVHLLALWAFAWRRIALGIGLYILGKLAATAIIGRILIVCRPALLQLRWFARADLWVTTTRARIHDALAATAFWQNYLALRARLRGLFAERRGRPSWWALARRAVRGKPAV